MNITFRQCLLTTLFFLVPYIISAQGTVDSLTAFSPQKDSLLAPDSSVSKNVKSAIADKIPYKADRISISPNGNKIYLNGNAQIIYENLTLNAENITIDKVNNKLYASGIVDSIDANGKEYFKGNPVFVEKGQEPMKGKYIVYDFNTRRGKINVGLTKMEPGYYKGSNIYKIADSTLLIEDGYFTSCSLEENPHFYFRSDRMRLKLKDKMVAKPIYFYIADIPLAVVPFGIFPSKGGRRSGIIVPSYGEHKYGGRFLEGLGYYWAPNDYMDATLESTFYERRGWTFRGNTRYAVRYLLNGQLSGSYDPKDRITGKRRDRWNFSYRHRQTIDPTFSISGSGRFSSDKNYIRQTSANVEERLRQNINSSLSLNKSWKGTKNSMSASFSHNQNLQTDETDWTFPNVSFRRGQSSIYETISGESIGTNSSWYQKIYFNYSANGLRKGSHKIAYTQTDSTIDTSFVDRQDMGLRHTLGFSSPQKAFKYFNITPSISYNEIWVDEITKGRLNEDSTNVEEYKKKTFGIRRTFSSSIGVNTKVYGLFEPDIGDLKFIRHTLNPAVSFSYTPDFSDPSYGYFDKVINENGQTELIDKFKNSPFGGTGSRESKRMNLSLGNLFQAKFIDDEEKEEKIDFFKANFSASHNFTSDSLKWSDLRSNFNTRILGKNITITTTHSLYKIKDNGGKRDQLFYEDGNLPRLINLNTSFGYTINNKTFAPEEDEKNISGKTKKDDLQNEDDTDQISEQDSSLEDTFNTTVLKERERTKKINIPWSTSFLLNYSLNRANPAKEVERISLSTNADFTITKNWKISWRANFDLVEKDLVYQNINIYRDLHCWEMSFNWQPLQGYFLFRINIKDPSLQDIKYTRRPRGNIYSNY